MSTDVHQLDDGAWLSVNGTREVSVSECWRLADHGVCDCPVADFLVEGFVAVSADGGRVDGRVAGQCIACGDDGITGWLPLGRVDGDRFRPVAPGAIRSPTRP